MKEKVVVKRKPKHRRLLVLLIIVGAIVALLLYGMVDPTAAKWMPKCPMHWLTGLNCPGCGLQRCIHSIIIGDFASAFRFNALFVLILPYLLLIGITEIWPDKFTKLYKFLNSSNTLNVVMIVVLGWMLIRNILGI